MALSYQDAETAYNAGSGTALSAAALSVAAKDILVCMFAYEGYAVGNTVTFSDDVSNTYSQEAITVGGSGGIALCIGYVLSAKAGETTVTATLNAAKAYRAIGVMQFRPDGSDTISKDDYDVAIGNSTSIASGAITTTGDDVVVVGAHKGYTGRTLTAQSIGGIAADGVVTWAASYLDSMWYRILNATATDITATLTASGSTYYVCGILAIKSVALSSGSGGNRVPYSSSIFYSGRGMRYY